MLQSDLVLGRRYSVLCGDRGSKEELTDSWVEVKVKVEQVEEDPGVEEWGI